MAEIEGRTADYDDTNDEPCGYCDNGMHHLCRDKFMRDRTAGGTTVAILHCCCGWMVE
jgi:hypothetical protein